MLLYRYLAKILKLVEHVCVSYEVSHYWDIYAAPFTICNKAKQVNHIGIKTLLLIVESQRDIYVPLVAKGSKDDRKESDLV